MKGKIKLRARPKFVKSWVASLLTAVVGYFALHVILYFDNPIKRWIDYNILLSHYASVYRSHQAGEISSSYDVEDYVIGPSEHHTFSMLGNFQGMLINREASLKKLKNEFGYGVPENQFAALAIIRVFLLTSNKYGYVTFPSTVGDAAWIFYHDDRSVKEKLYPQVDVELLKWFESVDKSKIQSKESLDLLKSAVKRGRDELAAKRALSLLSVHTNSVPESVIDPTTSSSSPEK